MPHACRDIRPVWSCAAKRWVLSDSGPPVPNCRNGRVHFDVRVIATWANPAGKRDVHVDFLGGPLDLERIVPDSDFVCLLATLTERTRGLIGARELREMKRSAVLINTARGPLLVYDALLEALREGQIAGAAFDAYWAEPASPNHPLLKLDNFFLSPHVARFSDASIDYVTDMMIENIRRLAASRPLINTV